MKYSCLGLWLLCCALPVTASGTPQVEACTDPCKKAAIAMHYLQSPFLSPFRIDITVTDSIVTLEGNVADAGERALAYEIATGIDGVTDVVNRIRIEPAKHTAVPPLDCQTDDTTLAERVRTQLYWNRVTHGMVLNVTARDGIITLHGEAADRHQAELARLITLNTCGVKRVDSNLKARAEP